MSKETRSAQGSARHGMTGIKMKVREWRPRNGASGMRASEWSLGNEGLGMESREWSTVIMTCRRMILPFGDMKELYYRALFFVAFDHHRINSTQFQAFDNLYSHFHATRTQFHPCGSVNFSVLNVYHSGSRDPGCKAGRVSPPKY